MLYIDGCENLVIVISSFHQDAYNYVEKYCIIMIMYNYNLNAARFISVFQIKHICDDVPDSVDEFEEVEQSYAGISMFVMAFLTLLMRR